MSEKNWETLSSRVLKNNVQKRFSKLQQWHFIICKNNKRCSGLYLCISVYMLHHGRHWEYVFWGWLSAPTGLQNYSNLNYYVIIAFWSYINTFPMRCFANTKNILTLTKTLLPIYHWQQGNNNPSIVSLNMQAYVFYMWYIVRFFFNMPLFPNIQIDCTII